MCWRYICLNDGAWYRENTLIAIVQKLYSITISCSCSIKEHKKPNNEMCAKTSKRAKEILITTTQQNNVLYVLVHRSQSELAHSARTVHHIQSRRAHTHKSPMHFSFFNSIYTCLLAGIFLFFMWFYFVFIVSECSIVGWYFLAAFLVNGPTIDATQCYISRLVVSVRRYTWL